jgi:hypothetical protein
MHRNNRNEFVQRVIQSGPSNSRGKFNDKNYRYT